MPRVMITCPTTGEAAPTQLSMDAVTFGVISIDGFVVTCRLCGGEHPWSSEDAWVAGAEPPVGAPRASEDPDLSPRR